MFSSAVLAAGSLGTTGTAALAAAGAVFMIAIILVIVSIVLAKRSMIHRPAHLPVNGKDSTPNHSLSAAWVPMRSQSSPYDEHTVSRPSQQVSPATSPVLTDNSAYGFAQQSQSAPLVQQSLRPANRISAEPTYEVAETAGTRLGSAISKPRMDYEEPM